MSLLSPVDEAIQKSENYREDYMSVSVYEGMISLTEEKLKQINKTANAEDRMREEEHYNLLLKTYKKERDAVISRMSQNAEQ